MARFLLRMTGAVPGSVKRFLGADRSSFVLAALLIGLVGVRHRVLETVPEEQTDYGIPLKRVQGIFPDAGSLRRRQDAERRYLVLNSEGACIGEVVSSSPAADAITGYSGPVPLLVGFTENGRIVGVEMLPNTETAAFVEYIREEGFLRSWDGLTLEEALGKRVDAVSGATMTTSAMTATLRVALASCTAGSAQADDAGADRAVSWSAWATWCIVLFSLGAYFSPRRFRRLRPLLRVLNCAVVGLWGGFLLSLSSVHGWLMHGSLRAGLPVLPVIGLLAVFLPLLQGRDYYCTHLCPYGSIQDLAAGIWRGKRIRLPVWVGGFLRASRVLVLGGVFLVLLWGAVVDLAPFEPFAAFRFRSAPSSSLILAGAFLLLATVFPRLWCRHLCPTGFLLRCCRASQAGGGVRPGVTAFRRTACVLALGAAWILVFSAPRKQIGLQKIADKAPDRGVLSVIHNRKSVRRYTREPVSADSLNILLRAGMAAPTAGNAQPWAFVVLTEREAMNRIAAGFQYGKMLYHAAAAIVVCGVEEKALPGEAGRLWIQDCSAATENILLAAEGIGLGAVWVGCYPFEERIGLVKEVAALPAGVTPLCVVAIGHPAGVEKPKGKFRSENIHWERW